MNHFTKSVFFLSLLFYSTSYSIDLCSTAVFSSNDSLYTYDSSSDQKPEKFMERAWLHERIVRSPDCRWLVGASDYLIDLTKVQEPLEIEGLGNVGLSNAQFSPDSKWLVFSKGLEEEIHSINLTTMKVVKLKARHSMFQLVPDIEMVVSFFNDDLRASSLDGTDSYVISADFASYEQWILGGDGRTIYFTREITQGEDRVEVWKSNITGEAKKKVYELVGSLETSFDLDLHFATADNRRLLLRVVETGDFDRIQKLTLLDLPNKSESVLAAGQDVSFFSVSPDFSRIYYYFAETVASRTSFLSSNLDGSGKVDLGDLRLIDYSKDSARLLYHFWDEQPTPVYSIGSSKLDGTDRVKLVGADLKYEPVLYSRDLGQIYYFVPDPDGFVQAFSKDIYGMKNQNLFNSQWDTVSKALLSPNSKYILLLVRKMGPLVAEESYRLFKLDLATHKLKYIDEIDEKARDTLSFGNNQEPIS